MKIIFERNKCIGCGSCVAVCPNYWHIAGDAKSELKGSAKNEKTGNFELEISQAGCNQDAADGCPVQCIHVEK